MLPAEAGASGQAYYFERRNPMQKYFDSLDDYEDHSRHPLMDKVICNMRMALIFLACLALLFAVCGTLEAL